MSEHLQWLRGCIRDRDANLHSPVPDLPSLGMLTGQDSRALTAIDACWQLYSNSDQEGQHAALDAIANLIDAMQPKCHVFARALIARALDWSDIDRLWKEVHDRNWGLRDV